MSELTKEWLLKTIAELEEERDAVPGVVNEDAAKALAAMKRALASLEAEPVFEVEVSGNHWLNAGPVDDSDFSGMPDGVNKLYSAPPVPVSVPDEVNVMLNHLEDVLPDEAFNLIDVKTWNNVSMLSRPYVYRAAMLQGAEHVSNRDELPEGWVACSERMPGRDYVLAADFSGKQYPANMPNIQIGIYADWFDDGCPCWDDGDGNDLHLKQVTHWTQIPAAPQQEV